MHVPPPLQSPPQLLFIHALFQYLVVKPDQLIKRRGKHGLVAVNKSLSQVETWLNEHMNKEMQIGPAMGKLTTFVVEKFLPHKQAEEFYICILSNRTGNQILFYKEGGVDIGDVDAKANHIQVPTDSELLPEQVKKLIVGVPAKKQG